jgi:2-polyprenyl-3-methyl-5-hydroxy-6-metoxy-1,4-benzoquinol methylase
MRVTDTEKYYRENSADLGWGVEVARLDPERVELLNRYVVGPRVLDVACGSGIYTDYLASRGYDAWGIDLVGEFILKAKESKKGTYLQGEADRLPFADGEFDTVLLFDILEHGDDAAILKEAKRVASKRVVVNVPRKVDKELERTGIVFGHYVDKSHLREYTEERIRLLGQECDLELIFIQGVNEFNPIDIFKALFSGSQFARKVVKVVIMMTLRKRSYPTNIFAVFKI